MIITERQLKRIVSRIIEEKMREEMQEIDELEEAEIQEYDDADRYDKYGKKMKPLSYKNLTKNVPMLGGRSSLKAWFGTRTAAQVDAERNLG